MEEPAEGAGYFMRSAIHWLTERRDQLLFTVTVGLLAAGGAAFLFGIGSWATGLWIAATLLGLIYSTGTVVAALRRHQPSVDVIALLALVGALLVDESFAGAVVAVMLGTGRCWRRVRRPGHVVS